ncbi:MULTISPECIES: rod shape-determining protein MreD [Paenibacillus]|uniref:Rod shape-determining protein MreD n=1 Tax=Paenibacillus lutrae TaxID=2078573 RepID=A0A7X3FHF6_9BACL|nr:MULTISPECIES: rod shape-determining protein MreD [Paenibacillus]MVO99681.1 rod shape-determining protein MreD [Paenibacillus lutrae]
MIRNSLWLILMGLLILEGSLIHWLIPQNWQDIVQISSNFMLIIILYIGLYLNRHSALLYGLAFGMLHDFVYYGHILGVYSFGFGLIGYIAGMMPRRQSGLILSTLLMMGIGVLLFELTKYGVYRLFDVMNMDFEFAFTHIMLPSVLFNMLFALAVYIPMRKLMEALQGQKVQAD